MNGTHTNGIILSLCMDANCMCFSADINEKTIGITGTYYHLAVVCLSMRIRNDVYVCTMISYITNYIQIEDSTIVLIPSCPTVICI